MNQHASIRRGRIPFMVFVAATFLMGWLWRGDPAVPADARNAPAPSHFESGAARSLVILQQIADSLQRIEERLQRLETMAQRWSPPGQRPAEGDRLRGEDRTRAEAALRAGLGDGGSAR
jgi:hypothetical protein